MDLITNSKALKLRSHLDKYLIANDDNRTVCVSRNCITRRSTWIVEPSANPAAGTIRLKSYGTDLFLAASDRPSPFGVTGKRVVQSAPCDYNNDKGLIFDWEPIADGSQIKLKARGARGKFLRANSGPPPWNNSVTHDAPAAGATKFWTLWEVVPAVIEVQPEIDPLSPSTSESSFPPSEQSDDDLASGTFPASQLMTGPWSPRLSMNKSYGYTPPRSEGRAIYYHIAEEDGKVNEDDGQGYPLMFKGNSVEELTARLREDTGIKDIIVCTRSPLDGKLYPLRLHLPPNSVSMHIVVVPSASLAAP